MVRVWEFEAREYNDASKQMTALANERWGRKKFEIIHMEILPTQAQGMNLYRFTVARKAEECKPSATS